MRITSKSHANIYTAKPDEGMELAVVPWQSSPAQEVNWDRAMVPPYDMDMKIDNQALVQHLSLTKDNRPRYCA